MFDIGWSEMLVVGVVALIVVGPKDLPKMFHTLGEVTGKARGMAREFQRAMDAAARESGVNDAVKDFTRAASGQSIKEAAGFDEIDKQFRDIGHNRPDVRKPGSPANPTMPPAADARPEPDETDADEAEVQAHDAEVAARNAQLSATENERLKHVERSAAARQQAADIRARREADDDAAQSWRPASPKTPDAES